MTDLPTPTAREAESRPAADGRIEFRILAGGGTHIREGQQTDSVVGEGNQVDSARNPVQDGERATPVGSAMRTR